MPYHEQRYRTDLDAGMLMLDWHSWLGSGRNADAGLTFVSILLPFLVHIVESKEGGNCCVNSVSFFAGSSDEVANNILGNPSRGESFKMIAIAKLLEDVEMVKKPVGTPLSSPTRYCECEVFLSVSDILKILGKVKICNQCFHSKKWPKMNKK